MSIELSWMKQIPSRFEAKQCWLMCFDYRLCTGKHTFTLKFQLPLISYLMHTEVQIDECWIKSRHKIVPLNSPNSEANYFYRDFLLLLILKTKINWVGFFFFSGEEDSQCHFESRNRIDKKKLVYFLWLLWKGTFVHAVVSCRCTPRFSLVWQLS